MTLHTITRGDDAAAVTTLWVHGVDSDASVWDPAVDLVAADMRTVAIDLPGHGGSPEADDLEGYGRTAVLAEIDEIIAAERAARPERPVVWVGHSLGGYLGLAHALTRDGAAAVDGLVLVSTGPGFRDPEAMAAWNDRVQANAGDYSVSEAAATIAFHHDSMVMDRLTELTLPIGLVIGDGDRGFLGANDYLERKLPHASRDTVEGARHFVMRSHPESVSGAVRRVAAELEASDH